MFDDLEIILSKGESYTIEFKESPDKELPSEVCAFANASGGKVYIGIRDDGYVVGTDTSNAARSRIQDTVSKIEPRLNVGMEVHDNIIALTVPEGTHKPYSCPAGFFLRSGPNSQKLDRDSIIDFLQTEGKAIFDSMLNEQYLITDNFNEAEYQKFLKKSGISDVLPREAVLRNLGCAGLPLGGSLSFTNAGLLFFRDNSQNVPLDFTHVACALYKGLDKVDIIDVRNLDGGIMANIDNAIVFLKRNLRVRYEIKTAQRENILELPEDALREGVTNAVCHRDYFENGARVMVEIFDDRVEITNPGGAPKGITKDNFGSTSVTRNPNIASLLHRADYIERMGTGIKRMTSAMEKAGLEAPIFLTEGFFFKVTFKRSQPDADSGIAIDSDRTAIDSDRTAIDIDRITIETNSQFLVILKYLGDNGRGKNADFAKLLGLGPQRTRQILNEMVQNGIIEKHGEKRYAYYTVVKKPFKRT